MRPQQLEHLGVQPTPVPEFEGPSTPARRPPRKVSNRLVPVTGSAGGDRLIQRLKKAMTKSAVPTMPRFGSLPFNLGFWSGPSAASLGRLPGHEPGFLAHVEEDFAGQSVTIQFASATVLTPCSLMSAATILAPCAASRLATAAPIPEAAPVTRASFSARFRFRVGSIRSRACSLTS